MHSEAKQHKNLGACSREKFIAETCKETGGLCLKKPQRLQGFQQSLSIEKMKRGVASCCKLLGIRSSFLLLSV